MQQKNAILAQKIHLDQVYVKTTVMQGCKNLPAEM